MGTTVTRSEQHALAATNSIEFRYKKVFEAVDIALTRGDYSRAQSMVRRAADGHPKIIHSEEELTPLA